MKTNLRFLALSAAILSMFTACQREELEQNQKPEALTHSVTFVAGAPETKTTVDVSDDETASLLGRLMIRTESLCMRMVKLLKRKNVDLLMVL